MTPERYISVPFRLGGLGGILSVHHHYMPDSSRSGQTMAFDRNCTLGQSEWNTLTANQISCEIAAKLVPQ